LISLSVAVKDERRRIPGLLPGDGVKRFDRAIVVYTSTAAAWVTNVEDLEMVGLPLSSSETALYDPKKIMKKGCGQERGIRPGVRLALGEKFAE
jgi:hypothetical protein